MEFLKRRIVLLSFKNDLRSRALTNQKNICPVCSKNLIDLNKYKRSEIIFDGDTQDYASLSTGWSLLDSQIQSTYQDFRVRS
jgi:hypothetical protein